MPASPAVAFASTRMDVSGIGTPVVAVKRDIILLVEDDDMVSMLISSVLERMRWRVIRADDGASGERLAVEHGAAIALALVDSGLPDTEGADLCARLRTILPGLPLLLTSGREHSSLVQALAVDGPAAFLGKPFLPAEVMRQVQALVARVA